MNVLVTGANGFIGTHLCRLLVKKKINLSGMVRKNSDLTHLETLIPGFVGIDLLYGDVTNIGSLRNILTDKDVIINLAGITSGLTQFEYDSVNVTGSRNICEALLGVNSKVNRVIMFSSVAGAGPSPPGGAASEDRPPTYLKGDRYGFSKWKMERLMRSYMDKLPIVIIRPPVVLGPGDVATLLLYKLPKLGIKLVVGGGRRYYSIVNVGDLCDGIYQCAVHPKAAGEVFYFTTGDPVEWDELQEIIGVEVFGKRYNSLFKFKIPPGLLVLAGSIVELINKLGKTTPFFNRSKAIEVNASGWACSSEKAQKLLGWKSNHTINSTVEQAGKWYKKQNML